MEGFPPFLTKATHVLLFFFVCFPARKVPSEKVYIHFCEYSPFQKGDKSILIRLLSLEVYR